MVLLALIQKILRGIRQFILICLVLAIRVCFNISGWHCSLVTRQLWVIKTWVLGRWTTKRKNTLLIIQVVTVAVFACEYIKSFEIKNRSTTYLDSVWKGFYWSGAAVNNSPKRGGLGCPHWLSVHPGVWATGWAGGCRLSRPPPLPVTGLAPGNSSHSAEAEKKGSHPESCFVVTSLTFVSDSTSLFLLLDRALLGGDGSLCPGSSLGWVTLCSALLPPCLECSSLSPSPVCPHTAASRQLLGRKGTALPCASAPLGWCVFL